MDADRPEEACWHSLSLKVIPKICITCNLSVFMKVPGRAYTNMSRKHSARIEKGVVYFSRQQR